MPLFTCFLRINNSAWPQKDRRKPMDFRLKGPNGQATLRKVPGDRPLNDFLQERRNTKKFANIKRIKSCRSIVCKQDWNNCLVAVYQKFPEPRMCLKPLEFQWYAWVRSPEIHHVPPICPDSNGQPLTWVAFKSKPCLFALHAVGTVAKRANQWKSAAGS